MTNIRKAIAFSLLGFLLFSNGDITRKYLLQFYDPLDLQFWVCISAMIVVCFFSPLMGGIRSLGKVSKPHIHVVKSGLICCIILLAIFCLNHLDLATFYTLVFLAPLFTSLGGALFFKESLQPYHFITLALGFLGVLVVLRPGFQQFDWTMLLAIMLGLIFSANALLNKVFPPTDPRLPFGFYPYVLAISVCYILTSGAPDLAPLKSWPLVVFAGGCSGLAMVAHVIAFQSGPAATAAPYHYSQLVWGAMFGYIIFGDVPDIWTWFGATLIIGAGVYLYLHENRMFRRMISRVLARVP